MSRRVWITVGLGLALLAGCGPLNPGTIISTGGNANVRVLNGSPGTTINATLDSATGGQLASALAYEKVAAYASITASNHSVFVTSTTSAFPTLTCPVGVLTAGYDYTVVVAGNPASGSAVGTGTALQCQVFLEPPYAGTATVGNFQLHHASPAANADGYTVLSIYSYPTASPTSYSSTPLGSAQFNATPTSTITTFSTALTLNSSTGGVGFAVSPQTMTPAQGNGKTQLFLPQNGIAASNSATVSDPSNLFPTSNLVNLSIYAVDAPYTGSPVPYNLVGVFEGI